MDVVKGLLCFVAGAALAVATMLIITGDMCDVSIDEAADA